MTHKWAWRGSRDRILHSKDELLISQLITSKVNDMFINKNKTANIKGKKTKGLQRRVGKVDYTDVTQLKMPKNKVILHCTIYIVILAMYCRVLSPFYFCSFSCVTSV